MAYAVTFLEIYLKETNGQLFTRLHDKADDFKFAIIHFLREMVLAIWCWFKVDYCFPIMSIQY